MVVHESPSAMTVAYGAHMLDNAQHLPCAPALTNFPETACISISCSEHRASTGKHADADQVDRVL